MKETDNCLHCGADIAIHRYTDFACPLGGKEVEGKRQVWLSTTFTSRPEEPAQARKRVAVRANVEPLHAIMDRVSPRNLSAEVRVEMALRRLSAATHQVRRLAESMRVLTKRVKQLEEWNLQLAASAAKKGRR